MNVAELPRQASRWIRFYLYCDMVNGLNIHCLTGVIKVDKVTKGFYETIEIYEPIMEGLVKLKVTQQRPTVKVSIRLAQTETSNGRRSGQQRKGNEGGGNKRADGTRERGEGPYKRVEGSNIHHERVNQRKEGTNKEELRKEQSGSKPKRTHRKKPHAASGANGPNDQKVGGESRRKISGDNTTTAGTGRPRNKPSSANRNKHKPPRDNSNHQNNPSGSKASGRNAHQGDMQAPVVNGTAAGNG
ncbi:hypothetical protein SARC_00261 [Sphaeroforma arctica JP610]|uniref:Uncharacterized protein n=1 Tax=Sphaeroforma arctica JP610 TaxID=667725 RepID=A0A0L0GF20_9EUKA|nr:hypothetical protein SARC_00261 [Sphaeroforma arctica JP610]KNC87630.1 hypothetical protein SARC_00261 [Sphaeroforma arctica JP610]|eukprot:XP_014161532.1 hypothetical protein SARC_00261 [Sphaeroforma arctica JP610]